MSRRSDRVGDVLRQELSEIMARHLQDPRLRLASVARVDVSPDLRHARIWVSVLGDDDARGAALEALEHARGFVRSQLASRLRHMRSVPDLDFRLDRGAEYGQRIDDLLKGSDA